MNGLTEFRAGVYMFGDLFQAEIETHGRDSIALTVLTSVIGRRPGALLIDAGRAGTVEGSQHGADAARFGFGLVLDIRGERLGEAIVRKAYQEHGVIEMNRTDGSTHRLAHGCGWRRFTRA